MNASYKTEIAYVATFGGDTGTDFHLCSGRSTTALSRELETELGWMEHLALMVAVDDVINDNPRMMPADHVRALRTYLNLNSVEG